MRRLTLLLLAALTTFACTRRQTVEVPTPWPVILDTVVEEPVVTAFPDTLYASAEKLLIVIDTIDASLPSELNSLEDAYADKPGIYTFRGSATRNPNFHGHLTDDTIQIKVDWEYSTRSDYTVTCLGAWGGGVGWTGQPLYVQWPEDSLQRKEIIVVSLCGDICFIDFETGEASRTPLDVKNVLKGTPALNSSLNGHLYIGHAVPKGAPFGTQVVNLYTRETINLSGRDNKAWRSWGGYDSSPLEAGGFLFRPAENGGIYKYYIGDGGYRLQSVLRYSTTKAKASPGMESSMAICRNYGYIGDNAGNILCINLNTMKPVWTYWNHDDTDASPVVELEDGIPYVYTGCEVDRQGSKGFSHFIKLNGLTGELIWEDTIPCHKLLYGDKSSDGGMYVTPLLGEGDCEGLIFSSFCEQTSKTYSEFMAFDKQDGRIVYRLPMKHECWSSPVAFYNDKGEMFIFIGDRAGTVYLIKGKTGEIIASEKIGFNFESSPIVVDNKIIVGSRGNKIFKISLQ